MAQKVQVLYVDDIDGKEANQTVEFALDGTRYEIDLSEKNASKLRDTLAPYVGAGRKLARTGRPYRRTDLGPNPREVRAWAKKKKLKLSPRGRIPADILEQYKAENSH